jgi:hypothetical protein
VERILSSTSHIIWIQDFAARFHERLIESLFRLGVKKTKHEPILWIADMSSHFEYLATYVDDIFIRSKDPIAVIKSF